MFSMLRRLFRRGRVPEPAGSPLDDDSEWDWMVPPVDPRDAEGWDNFWTKHMENELGPPFHDMFCNDRGLICKSPDKHIWYMQRYINTKYTHIFQISKKLFNYFYFIIIFFIVVVMIRQRRI